MANAKTLNHNKMVKLTTAGILTAVVVVFQLLGSFIRFGTFSISLVLIPIVIGAALCGPAVSAWLGFVFSIIVLLQPDTAVFLAISVSGTVITVILKGSLCGLFAGLVFDSLKKVNTYLAVIIAAIVCPLTNTGIFLLGSRLFFFETISEWGAGAGFENPYVYMLVGFVGLNFIFELATNVILSPAVVRVVNTLKKKG